MSENPLSPPPVQPLKPPLSPEEANARMWNMLCHLSALVGFVGIPLGNILGPLVVWQIKKNQIPSVDIHGKASLNFQITLTIALMVGFAVAFVTSFFCIGYLLFPLVFLVALCGLVFPIIAGIKANNGEDYKYPYSIEFIK